MDTQITKANYFESAQAFVAKLPTDQRKNLPVITDRSENFKAWREYFERHLGWTPYVLKLVLAKQTASLTVPAYWPGWFDSSFVENHGWRPVQNQITPKHLRESLEQLRRRHGPNWGLKGIPRRDTEAQAERSRLAFGGADLEKPISISQQLLDTLRPRQQATE